MTNAQLTILCSALGAIASAAGFCVRWAVTQITDAIKANTASNLELARESARLSTRIDLLGDFVHEHTPVNQPVPEPAPRKTPPLGVYSHVRSKTSG